VGVYFITQNPADVPDKVLGQLGNRVQHALRAFSPRDQKAVRAAAETMRDNPDLDEEATITELGVGEALVSLLDEKGRPTMVERALIVPPHAQIGPITPEERQAIKSKSMLGRYYDVVTDRESAYEKLKGRAEEKQAEEAAAAEEKQSANSGIGGMLGGLFGSGTSGTSTRRQSVGETLAKTVVRTVGSEVGRQIVRGILGSLLGKRR
jgi:DNA helicase HerA-like ATPase